MRSRELLVTGTMMALITLLVPRSYGGVQPLINYQGRLTTPSGSPVSDGIYTFALKIYSDSLAGTALWSETKAVQVTGGLFTTHLGSAVALPDTLFSSGVPRFLGITVNLDPEMTRVRLLTVPAAYHSLRSDSAVYAANANLLDGLDTSSFAPAAHSHVVTTAEIQNGTILFEDIAQNGATAGQVMKWNGSAWVAANDSTGGGAFLPLAGGTMTGPITSTGDPPITMGKGSFGSGNTNSGLNAFAAGQGNTASGPYSSVSGGRGNSAGTESATVGGGESNNVTGIWGTIGGGTGNSAGTQSATVGGGEWNNVTGIYGTIGGGLFNLVQAAAGTVGGGWNNYCLGAYSVIPGGQSCRTSMDYSFAAGRQAKANHYGSFVWSDGWDALDFVSTAGNEFSVRCTGGARFVTWVDIFGNPTAGVSLASGGGSWSSISDRNAKEDFAPVDGSELIAKLASVPIGTWKYKSQDQSIRHVGPMAQDFYAAFGVGEDDKHITTVDADGVALAAIQELARRLDQKTVEVQELRAMIEALQRQVEAQSGNPK